MKKIVLLALMAALVTAYPATSFPAGKAKPKASADMVYCCRYDCGHGYCKRWPKGCYRIVRSHCEYWESHGHAEIVDSCEDCTFRKMPGQYDSLGNRMK
jgi:hypothetical protein